MPFVKNSDEAKANMERVRNAKQHKKQLSLSPILKDVKDTHVEFDEIELPKDKFLLLLMWNSNEILTIFLTHIER